MDKFISETKKFVNEIHNYYNRSCEITLNENCNILNGIQLDIFTINGINIDVYNNIFKYSSSFKKNIKKLFLIYIQKQSNIKIILENNLVIIEIYSLSDDTIFNFELK